MLSSQGEKQLIFVFQVHLLQRKTSLVAPPVGIILFFANISLPSEDWEFFKSPQDGGISIYLFQSGVNVNKNNLFSSKKASVQPSPNQKVSIYSLNTLIMQFRIIFLACVTVCAIDGREVRNQLSDQDISESSKNSLKNQSSIPIMTFCLFQNFIT